MTTAASSSEPLVRRVDARGLLCPVPVIHLAQAMASLGVGDQIELLADDPAAATDVPAWCRMRGHALVGTPTRDGEGWRFLIRCAA